MFMKLRGSYSIVKELCPRSLGTFFRLRCRGTQHLIISRTIFHCETITGRYRVFAWAVVIIGPCLVSSRPRRSKNQDTSPSHGYVLIVPCCSVRGARRYD